MVIHLQKEQTSILSKETLSPNIINQSLKPNHQLQQTKNKQKQLMTRTMEEKEGKERNDVILGVKDSSNSKIKLRNYSL